MADKDLNVYKHPIVEVVYLGEAVEGRVEETSYMRPRRDGKENEVYLFRLHLTVIDVTNRVYHVRISDEQWEELVDFQTGDVPIAWARVTVRVHPQRTFELHLVSFEYGFNNFVLAENNQLSVGYV